jgi:hypothetical protein
MVRRERVDRARGTREIGAKKTLPALLAEERRIRRLVRDLDASNPG